jgi:hypothetical protein
MKRYLVGLTVLLIHLFFNFCGSEPNYFSDRTWYILDYSLNENDSVQLEEILFIKNDSAYSYSYLEKKTYAYPITKAEDKLIYTKVISVDPILVEKFPYADLRKTDTTMVDTVSYDFKFILGRQVLVLKSINSNHL